MRDYNFARGKKVILEKVPVELYKSLKIGQEGHDDQERKERGRRILMLKKKRWPKEKKGPLISNKLAISEKGASGGEPSPPKGVVEGGGFQLTQGTSPPSLLR